jgi:hypothetical protein
MVLALLGFPKNVVGFICSGRVTKHDYDSVLIPHVESVLQTEQTVCLYYETAPDFSIDLDAAWEDVKLGVEHLKRWECIAVVTDVEWLRNTLRAFSFLVPGRLRVFSGSESEHARAWIVAKHSK